MDEQHAPLVVANEIEQNKMMMMNNENDNKDSSSYYENDSRAPNLPTSNQIDKLDSNSLNYANDFEEQIKRPTKQYRDVFYLALFAINSFIVLGIGIFGGVQCMAGNGNCMNADTNPHHTQSVNERPKALVAPMAVSFVVAAMMCSIMIVILQFYSESFLKCIFIIVTMCCRQ